LAGALFAGAFFTVREVVAFALAGAFLTVFVAVAFALAGAFFTALVPDAVFFATVFLAGAFLAGAFLAGAFLAGAFFAAVLAAFFAGALRPGAVMPCLLKGNSRRTSMISGRCYEYQRQYATPDFLCGRQASDGTVRRQSSSSQAESSSS